MAAAKPSGLPSGVVTFVLTDLEGSTRLWEERPVEMGAAVERHDAVVAATVEGHGGHLLKAKGEGDSAFIVFESASAAVACALDLARALGAASESGGIALMARIAVHTGEAVLREGDYFGPAVNRCARMRSVGHGGQVIVSGTTAMLVGDALPEGASLTHLGEHRLRDLTAPMELLQLCHRHRLVTLLGTGGCGKSRLALRVASAGSERLSDGAWFADLGTLADPGLVPHRIATSLGIAPEPASDPIETLTGHLRHKRCLVLLDNCEHLVSACAEAAGSLLRSCPGLRILATSREPLALPGEVLHRVRSLSAPPEGATRSPEELLGFESVRLFAERAAEARREFAVTPANAGAVEAICRRLDGIPLALELAAARVRALDVAEIAERLDDRLSLLAGGAAALPRHQTLRATLEWSHDLLGEDERLLFRRVSVFAGPFSLAAAEEVCAGGGVGSEHVAVQLSQLVDRSLVSAGDQAGPDRYSLLETVRQFAREKLAGSGEGADVRRRHLAWSVALAEGAAQRLEGADQAAWLDRLEALHDGFRAALAFAVTERAALDDGLRLGAALAHFWQVRGFVSEGRAWLEAALRAGGGAGQGIGARALAAAGALAWHQGDHARAVSANREAVDLFRVQDDRPGLAQALNNLGAAAHARRDFDEARALYNESLAIRREVGDRWGEAQVLNNLGAVALARGDLAGARALCEEGLAIRREVGDARGICETTSNLGVVLHALGDPAGAKAMYEDGLAIARRLEDRAGISAALNNLGEIAADAGDHAGARRHYEESLAIRREVGDRRGIAESLFNLAEIMQDAGLDREALPLYAESMSLDHAIGDDAQVAGALAACGRHADAVRLAALAAALGGADTGRPARLPPASAGALEPAAIDAAWREGLALSPAMAAQRVAAHGRTTEPSVE